MVELAKPREPMVKMHFSIRQSDLEAIDQEAAALGGGDPEGLRSLALRRLIERSVKNQVREETAA